MYICKKFTAEDIERMNADKRCIYKGQSYVVTRYSVDVTSGIPVVFKEEDIAAFGLPADAEACCISTYANELDIEHGIQYFYKVRRVRVCALNTELDGLLNMYNKE
jgi:hypothetical protein